MQVHNTNNQGNVTIEDNNVKCAWTAASRQVRAQVATETPSIFYRSHRIESNPVSHPCYCSFRLLLPATSADRVLPQMKRRCDTSSPLVAAHFRSESSTRDWQILTTLRFTYLSTSRPVALWKGTRISDTTSLQTTTLESASTSSFRGRCSGVDKLKTKKLTGICFLRLVMDAEKCYLLRKIKHSALLCCTQGHSGRTLKNTMWRLEGSSRLTNSIFFHIDRFQLVINSVQTHQTVSLYWTQGKRGL